MISKEETNSSNGIKMRFESSTKTVKEYIVEEATFKVPAFQRPYSWAGKDVIKLINDAINQKDAGHFIGAFIISKNENSNEAIIIDGQQRLTSIMLIMCAIRDWKYKKHKVCNECKKRLRCKKCKEYAICTRHLIENYKAHVECPECDNLINKEIDENYKEMKNFIFNGIKNNNLDLKYTEEWETLFAGEERDEWWELFNDITNRKKVCKNNMLLAYKAAYRYIEINSKNEEKFPDLVYSRIKNLIFTEISSQIPSDAYYVFRSLNSSGKPLDFNDHVKAHIFSYLDINNNKKGQIDSAGSSYIDKWNQIKDNVKTDLDSKSVDTFTKNFARVNFWSLNSFSDEYDMYFNAITDKSEAQQYFKEMLEDSNIYHKIVNPSVRGSDKPETKELRSIQSNLKFLKDIYIKQHVQLVYSAYKYVSLAGKKYPILVVKSVKEEHSGWAEKKIEEESNKLSKQLSKQLLKQLQDLTGFLAKFHFVYNKLSTNRGNRLTSKYSRYSKNFIDLIEVLNKKSNLGDFIGINSEQDVSEIIDALVEEVSVIISSIKSEFNKILEDHPHIFENSKGAYSELDYDNDKSLIGYVLHECFPKVSEETIEHIVPQSTEVKNVNKAGNLIFLRKSDNSNDVKDLPVSEKYNFYHEYKYIPNDIKKIIHKYANSLTIDNKFGDDEFENNFTNFREEMGGKIFEIFASDLGYKRKESEEATKKSRARHIIKPFEKPTRYLESSEGLAHMIGDLYFAYNYGVQTGDFSYAKKYLSQHIGKFDSYKEIDALYKRGGWVINGLHSYKLEDNLPSVGKNGGCEINVNVTRGYMLYCDPNRTSCITKNKHDAVLIFKCEYDEGYWKVLDVKNK